MSNGSISNKVIYNGVCDKCSKSYQRDIYIEDESVLNNPSLSDQEKAETCISNTEEIFCPNCTDLFVKWMSEKGYLKTDCWCNHIEEYKKEVEAKRNG